MTAAELASGSRQAENRGGRASRDGRGYRIGEAAALIGVSPSALRLWERQGLVRPARTSGRYRVYSRDDIRALRRVKRLRAVDKVNAPGIRRLLGSATDRSAAPEPSTVYAARLRALRQGRGLSLRETAATTGLSTSFISAVERGTTGASIAALQRLTSAYGATMLDLFGPPKPVGRLVRPSERPVLDVGGSDVRIEQLASSATQMEPQLFVLATGASSEGSYRHDGEEFIFVLEGSVRLWLGDDEDYTLQTGDALYFPSTVPHRWRNASNGETRLLWINTPPTF